MSSANILMYVAISFFVLAAASAVLAIIFFFKLDIRGVIGDLSGKTVAKEVQTMRAETKLSEESHSKNQIPQGKTTSTNLSKSGILERRRKAKEENKATELGDNQQLYMMRNVGATTVLSQDNDATTILQANDGTTSLLSTDNAETTLLKQECYVAKNTNDETTLLDSEEMRTRVTFKVLGSVIVIHTDEVIA